MQDPGFDFSTAKIVTVIIVIIIMRKRRRKEDRGKGVGGRTNLHNLKQSL